MKKIVGVGMVLAALMLAGTATWADEAAPAAGSTAVSQPAAAATPAVKSKKSKKAKKSAAKKETAATWVCPMGDYSGPKTKDGKCPTCGMDLVEKK